MRLGLSTFTFTWAVGSAGGELGPPPLGAFELVERARAWGVSVLQIADNLPLTEWDLADLTALRVAADRAEVSLEVGTRGIEDDSVERYLQIATVLGSPLVRLVVDTPRNEPSPSEVVARLSALRERFRAAGVRLAIENHDRFDAGTLAGVIRSLGEDWVGVCLDTVNSFGALEGPHAVVGTLAPLVVNLHVKDFVVRRVPHQMGFVVEGRAAGEGTLDVPWLLGALAHLHHDCSAILELWTPPESSLDATIAKELRWAERSVAYLSEQLSGSTAAPARGVR